MLTESMEDYLEWTFRLIHEKGYARAVELADAQRVQASSVTKMIQKLDEAGFILYERYRNIALTEKGKEYGRFLVWRDRTLKEFLTLLNASGVAEQVEGMEHYITPRTMDIISELLDFFRSNPDAHQAFREWQKERPFSSGGTLTELRAWEYRHNVEP